MESAGTGFGPISYGSIICCTQGDRRAAGALGAAWEACVGTRGGMHTVKPV